MKKASVSEHKRTGRDSKSVQEASKRSPDPTPNRFAKTDVRYWQQAVFRPTYTRSGQTRETAAWAVKIQHRGRRETFALGTPNRAAAAARAKQVYQHLVGAGWGSTLAKWKPAMQRAVVLEQSATVGEFVTAVKAASTVRPKTLEGYAKAFRMIVAQVAGIKADKSRFDYHTGGNQRWLEEVHAVSLDTITPAAVQAWKAGFLRARAIDPLAEKSARVSVNAFIRNAKALFSQKLLALVPELKLPEKLPFAGISSEKLGSQRYRSRIQVEALLTMARRELSVRHPEQWKVFVLALLVGLRRNEIDKLEWTALDFRNGVIRIETTNHLKPKADDGDVEVDPEVLDLLGLEMTPGKGPFIIQGSTPACPAASHTHYRANKHFKALITWLRSKGVSDQKPIHTLRKEFGSLMTDQFGIYAASRALRHSRLEVTAAYYADRKTRKTLDLRSLTKAE